LASGPSLRLRLQSSLGRALQSAISAAQWGRTSDRRRAATRMNGLTRDRSLGTPSPRPQRVRSPLVARPSFPSTSIIIRQTSHSRPRLDFDRHRPIDSGHSARRRGPHRVAPCLVARQQSRSGASAGFGFEVDVSQRLGTSNHRRTPPSRWPHRAASRRIASNIAKLPELLKPPR
jgi:hypothetical protein